MGFLFSSDILTIYINNIPIRFCSPHKSLFIFRAKILQRLTISIVKSREHKISKSNI